MAFTRIKFATDGVADLPKALLEKYDIGVVPKPILQVDDNDIQHAARVRTYRKVVDFVIHMLRQQRVLAKLAIVHANNCDGALAVMERVKDIVPSDAIITDIGPTLHMRVGPGAVGFASVSATGSV